MKLSLYSQKKTKQQKTTASDIRKSSSKKASPLHGTRVRVQRSLIRSTKRGIRTVLLSPVFHTTTKIVLGLIVSSVLLYTSYSFIGRTFANEVVVSQSEIVARVAKLTPLPATLPYEIVRVENKEVLRTQNPFYKNVEEGDYILIYKDIAVIYNLRDNVIVGIKRSEIK